MSKQFKHQAVRENSNYDITWSFYPPAIKAGKSKMSESVKHIKRIVWKGYNDIDWWGNISKQDGYNIATDEAGRLWALNFETSEVIQVGKESIIDTLKKIAINVIKYHTSKENALTMDEFAFQIGTSARQLRLIVAELRRYNPFGDYYLVSDHANGYWISNNVEDIDNWISGSQSFAKSLFVTLRSAAKLASHKKQIELYGDLFEFQQEMLAITKSSDPGMAEKE